jgi:hypothetical protein
MGYPDFDSIQMALSTAVDPDGKQMKEFKKVHRGYKAMVITTVISTVVAATLIGVVGFYAYKAYNQQKYEEPIQAYYSASELAA